MKTYAQRYDFTQCIDGNIMVKTLSTTKIFKKCLTGRYLSFGYSIMWWNAFFALLLRRNWNK